MSEHLSSLQDPLPNLFTEGIGVLIRQAREERHFSQRKLASQIGRRQAAISMMENGQMEPDASTLVMIAEVLQKPITFFLPAPWGPRVARGDLTYDEQALLLEFRRLDDATWHRVAIALLSALANLEA